MEPDVAKKSTTKSVPQAKAGKTTKAKAPVKAAAPIARSAARSEKGREKKASAPAPAKKDAATDTVVAAVAPKSVKPGAKPAKSAKSKSRDVPKNLGNRAAPTSSDAPVLETISEEELRKVKTGLTKRDLDHYRKLLREKRSEILGDVESLKTDALDNAAGGNLSNMPLHMADVGSDSYEQEFTLGLMESERKLLNEIHEALKRIDKGVFGVCLTRGTPINRARLDIKPWASHCIEVERELERHYRR